MNLFMEMCMLGVTFGACVGSIFGMNLSSGLVNRHQISLCYLTVNNFSLKEENPYAFYLTTMFLVIGSGLIITFFLRRFSKITDSGKARNYPVLKDFFKYVDTIELLRFTNNRRQITKAEFSDLMAKVVSKEVTRY